MVRRLVGSNAVARVALMLVLPGCAFSGAAEAQAPKSPGRTALTLNPLGLPAEYVSAELETRLSAIASLGLSLSYFGPNDVTYLSTEAKLRLYPNEEALKGFSVGVGLGAIHVSEEQTRYVPVPGAGGNTVKERRSNTKPTVSAIVDYNWLLGKTKRVIVGGGVGLKRILGSDDEYSDISFIYPTFRFQIGVLF